MQCKVVCPKCGDVVKTYSINNFRHCGTQFDVESNLLAGEAEKYQKMMEKEGKKVPVVEKEKPVEKIVEKLEEKKNDTPVVEPIIEEKPEPVVEKKVVKKRKKKSVIVEKDKKEIPAEDVYSFGFFE